MLNCYKLKRTKTVKKEKRQLDGQVIEDRMEYHIFSPWILLPSSMGGIGDTKGVWIW